MSKIALSLKIAGGVLLLLLLFIFPVNADTLSEGFEFGVKPSYADADVMLSTGAWHLDDALIGNTSKDIKSGTQSTRVRNNGSVTMDFDRPTGAGTVTVKYAKYGSDGDTTWQLRCSTNSGASWLGVGQSITANSQSLQTATFTPNIAGPVRCEVRKTDGTSERVNIDDIIITDYVASASGVGSPEPSDDSSVDTSETSDKTSVFLPFFDNVDNPVPVGFPRGSLADVTPLPPSLNDFDKAVNKLCGMPGIHVSEEAFQDMMREHPTVLANLKQLVGGSLEPRRTSDEEFLDDLTHIWFNVKGFEHVFCGEPVEGGSIGGLHLAARYLQLQENGWGGRLADTSRAEVVDGVIYTIGAITKVGNGTAQSLIKGYPYTINAEEMLSIGTLGYKNNPNNGSSNQVCNLRVSDEGKTFSAVFVRRGGGIRTLYPDATPGNNADCMS